MRHTLLVLVFTSAVTVFAGPPHDIPLNATYRDNVEDGIRSDGLTSFTGSSAHYVHGADDNALVIIQDTGNYRFSTRLDSRKPLRRRLCFDFRTQPSPLPSVHCADVLIGQHGEGSIQDMQYGDVLDKRTKHSWTFDGYEYQLGFGIDWDLNGTFDTTPASVTCVAPIASPGALCTSWTMTSNGVATLSRAKVLSKTKFGPRELIGYYDMPFEVRFTR